MVEENNVRHHSILYEVSDLEDTLRKFCSALPKDRLLTGNDAEDGSSVVKGISPRIYRDPETGATLTYGSSLAILSHFVSCLPHKDEMMLKPRYYVHSRQNQYSSEVVLPENSPIRSAIGHPASQKVLAKQGAAFEMCLQLRRGGHLDSNLLPIYTRRTLPAMRNALLALDLKKTLEYPMRTKPSIWSVAEEKVPAILYLTTLELESPEGLGKPYQPLGVLTRVKLPKFPQFPVHFDAGKLSDVVCSSLELGFGPTEQFIEEITAFTLCVFEDLFNKFYLPDPRTLPYWLVPIRDNIKITTKLHPQNVIQLELITEVFNQENKRRAEAAEWALEVKPKNMNSAPQTPGVEGTSTPSTNTSNPAVADSVSNNREWPHKDKPASFWANRFLVDEFSGGRRLFTIGVVPELKPMDPVPPSCARAKYMDSTILKYSTSVFRNTWAKIEPKLSREQPVILASQVVHRRNWLDKQEEKELKAITQAYVCPEPLKLSPLPTGLVAMGYIFPSIFSRLESYLIAKDCFEVLDLDVDLALALEAITKDSENTGSHDEEAIQFQRGMGKNYERLEFIGDSFLKMATTVSIFTELPEDTEFDYHVHRMVMIANKNLLNRAIEQKIYEYIRSQSFNRRTWYPREPKLLKGKGVIKDMAEGETVETYEEHKHRLGDKTIADVCEAIIGAALLTQNGGKNRFDNAVKAVTRLVKSDHHKAKCWDDYYANYKLPSFATIRTTAAELVVAGKVEEAHPYHFNHPRLLSSAFSHPSYPFSWERIPSYQRLEFLGDALWDMACIDWLFHTNPTRNPQWLTEHKMAMVSNKYQGALSVKLGFHKYLKANHDAVLAGVNDWVKDIQDAEAESQGSPDYWTTVKDPPKCLPDMLEAYIGAIFVDSKYDYKVVEDFFELHILPFFKDLALYDTYANNHPVTFLTEKLVNFYNCTNFRLFSKDIPSTDGSSTKILSAVIIHNEIVSEGVGSTSRYGKLEAAKQALTLLRDTSRAQFMMDYHCDCQKSKTSEGNEKDGVEGKVVAKKAAKKETAVKLASEVKV
ncbi:MAG: Dicer-like protein 1 [Trizodia sp. TS-e1964]|nr:MAG: Dicer-like protein 1 [Trizodia sp. TS-e1964]